ncbi:MAG: DUF4388 domain-containing protein [Trueperaceae bacterium]|nr:DUF4388 domain-containing protein [Trueperaceae bacterium]
MTGTLGLFSLVDLFQLLASSARTGRLTIDHPRAKARVYFDKGQIVHASFGEVEGEEAVYELFGDERGSFEFQVGISASQKTVNASTENLMLEAIRRLDEHNRDDDVMIPDEAVPVFTGNAQSSSLSLEPHEVELLKFMDGMHTIFEISEKTRTEPNDIKKVISRLVKVGVLKVRDKKPRTARLVTRLERDRLNTGTVGVDKNILGQWGNILGETPEQVACRFPDGRVLMFKAKPVEEAGPYIMFSMETLAIVDVPVNVALLVKPVV